MAQTYTRQSTFADGDTITAALFNDEYNQLVNAFTYSATSESSTGHRHDGTAGQGGNIPKIGDLDFKNKIEVDSTNNRFGFYVEVSSAAVEQIRIQDGAIVPVTDNDIDLGTSSLEFKDLYIDGTANIDTLSVDTSATIAGLTVSGTSTLQGDVYLGNASADTIFVPGLFQANLVPEDDSTWNLGSTTAYWANAYVDAVTTTGNVAVGGNLTVTGDATINGNLTFGNADTDSITIGAEIDSNLIPNTDDTYDIGSSTKKWQDIYIDGTAYLDAINFNGTAITATAAELNIMDGVTATATEINLLDGVTSTTAELNILDGVTSTATELNLVDGSSAGTVANSKAVIYGAAGEVNATTLQVGGVAITSTPAELNLLDGVTATTAELNILDGVTSTTAELNILDGVTATATELNILDGVTSTTAELNILDGVTATAAELNVLDGVTAFVDEDDMSSDSATSIPSQQSVKAYVDSQVASSDTLSELTDTNITTPADGALLFYDTTTSKWIDNVVSGDITIADTGVAAIGSGVIVNDDINASAAISVSKTALTAGTGLTLTTDTLSVDASQTQITAVGTIATGTWQGTAIADTYVANDLTISGGTVDNTIIGGTTAAAGTFTTFTSTGIDDNATSTAITIDSSENVGIGTTSPTAVSGGVVIEAESATGSEFIAGNSTAALSGGEHIGGFLFKNSDTSATDPHYAGLVGKASDEFGFTDLEFYAGRDTYETGGTPHLFIDGSNTNLGNVGIGTTSPARPLHVNSGTTNSGIKTQSTDSGAYIEFEDDSSTTNPLIGALGNDAVIVTNSSERMRIDSSGNVGIGTSGSLSNKLTLNGNQVLLANGELKFADGGNSLVSTIKNQGASGTSMLAFLTGSTPTERMRVTQAGYIGIGTTAPSYVLDVANNASETARFRFRSTVSGQAAGIRIQVADGTSNSQLEFGDSSDGDAGRIIYGHSANIMRFYTGASEEMRLENDGDLHVDGNVIAYSTTVSDKRLKDDVQDITGALDTVDALRGVTYTWNAGSREGNRDYGLIAQEVEQVIPEIVHDTTMPLLGDEETIYKTVDYEKLCAVLINAVSELRAEVEALKNGSN